ncbi:hypothetical protein ACET3Z_024972 [Daucus carota]
MFDTSNRDEFGPFYSDIPPPAVLMPVPVRPFVPATLLKRQYTMYRGREILPYLKPARALLTPRPSVNSRPVMFRGVLAKNA